ncbi:site-specific integrase [Planococcus alpniumensis]|uniref:site-specific integrase n=1 Tax=Planococcus alpniumensis TaxID=2708345 RepID=UPI001B8D7FBB|nr:site-specific integrase [Planococcus sp. MSAK28401]
MLKEYAEYRRGNNIKEQTLKYEIEQLHIFLAFVTNFAGRKLEPFEIKPLHVKKYLDHEKEIKQVTDTTIKRKLSTIRQYFHFLWEVGKVPNDFMPKVKYEYNIPEKVGSTNYQELLAKKKQILSNSKLLLNDKLYFLLTLKGIKLQDIERLTTENVVDAGNKIVVRFENSQGYFVKYNFYDESDIAVFIQAIERATFRDHTLLVASTNRKEANYLRHNLKEINDRLYKVINAHFRGEEIRSSYIHFLYKVEQKSLEEMAEMLGTSVTSITNTLKVVLERYKHMDYNKATN